MKPLPYFAGVGLSFLVLFFTYTDGGYHDATSFYAAAIASSYILCSSVAISVTRYGKTPQTRAWLFFGCGVIFMFTFIPAFRLVIELFYVPRRFDSDTAASLPVRELFFYGPVIIGALCIFRSFTLWSDMSIEKKEPIQPPQRNAGSRPHPKLRPRSARVADLNRSAPLLG